jgi:predicted DNA-binding transcriptional regulator YafY
VRLRDEGFDRPEGFDLATYWEEWSRSFEASIPRVEVRLRASELVRRFLPKDLRVEDDEYVVRFQSLDDAFRELLKFGADAEVLKPVELRERIGRTATDVAALYGVRVVR